MHSQPEHIGQPRHADRCRQAFVQPGRPGCKLVDRTQDWHQHREFMLPHPPDRVRLTGCRLQPLGNDRQQLIGHNPAMQVGHVLKIGELDQDDAKRRPLRMGQRQAELKPLDNHMPDQQARHRVGVGQQRHTVPRLAEPVICPFEREPRLLQFILQRQQPFAHGGKHDARTGDDRNDQKRENNVDHI